ncbi:hypothetical protein RB195_012580 [Necator americanus]
MSLCEYFNKLGVERRECGTTSTLPYRSTDQYRTQYDQPQTNSIVSSQLFGALPLCISYFHSCMSSTSCESGTICTNGVNAGSCCTNPSHKTCPSPTSLNIYCRKIRGVSWCNTDFDCHGTSSMPSICCPTGCNYNMCIRRGLPPPVPHIRRHIPAFSALSEQDTTHIPSTDCPDPYTLTARCVVRMPTSWCLTDSECPSLNISHPRKCCATSCGYNVCAIKYNGKWMVA